MRLEYPLTSNLMTHIVCEARSIQKVLDESLGISTTQYRILSTLQRLGGGQAPGAVARRLRLTCGAVTAAAEGLEEAGLVVKTRSDQDRRSKSLALTEAGAEKICEAEKVVALHVEQLWRPLPEEHRQVILAGIVSNDRTQRPSEPRGNMRAVSLYIDDFLIVSSLLSGTVRSHGMPVGAFRVLFELGSGEDGAGGARSAGGARYQFQLCNNLLMSANEVSKAADWLVGRGMLGRSYPPGDQRVVELRLTEAGRARMEETAEDVDEMFVRGSYETSEEERRAYREIADIVVERAKQARRQMGLA